MRLLPIVIVSLVLGFQAQAQPAAPPPDTTGKPAASAAHHRMSWKQRFAQANTTHDGHLTLDQAKAGYATIARHFDQIDTAKKGYVTLDDIANWHKAQRAAHHRNPGTADDSLRPRPAVHRSIVNPPATGPNNTDMSTAPADQHGTAPPATTKGAGASG